MTQPSKRVEECERKIEFIISNNGHNANGSVSYQVKEALTQLEEQVVEEEIRNNLTNKFTQLEAEKQQAVEEILRDFAEFAHTRYLGTDGKEYAYRQEVVYMVDDYLALTPEDNQKDHEQEPTKETNT